MIPCCPKYIVHQTDLRLDRVTYDAIPGTGPPRKPYKYKVRFNVPRGYDGATVVRPMTPKSNIKASYAAAMK